jgi:hypothetical protein
MFADTMQTRGFFGNSRICGKYLIYLAPRAGLEPATIRLLRHTLVCRSCGRHSTQRTGR